MKLLLQILTLIMMTMVLGFAQDNSIGGQSQQSGSGGFQNGGGGGGGPQGGGGGAPKYAVGAPQYSGSQLFMQCQGYYGPLWDSFEGRGSWSGAAESGVWGYVSDDFSGAEGTPWGLAGEEAAAYMEEEIGMEGLTAKANEIIGKQGSGGSQMDPRKELSEHIGAVFFKVASDGIGLLSQQRLCSTVNLLTGFSNASDAGAAEKQSMDGVIQCNSTGKETQDYQPCLSIIIGADMAFLANAVSKEFHQADHQSLTLKEQVKIIENPDQHNLALEAQKKANENLAKQAEERAIINAAAAAVLVVTSGLMPQYDDVQGYAAAVLGDTGGSGNVYGYENFKRFMDAARRMVKKASRNMGQALANASNGQGGGGGEGGGGGAGGSNSQSDGTPMSPEELKKFEEELASGEKPNGVPESAWDEMQQINKVRTNPKEYANFLATKLKNGQLRGQDATDARVSIAYLETAKPVGKLEPNAKLIDESQRWANQQASRNKMGHSGWGGAAENVSAIRGAGATSAIVGYIGETMNTKTQKDSNGRVIHRDLGHRRNLMNPGHRIMGVGVKGQYSTQRFR